MQPKNKKQIIKEFHEMKPSVAIKTMNFAKFPKEVAEKIKSDLSEISPEALDLQKDQSTFKKWIEQMAEMYPAVFGIVEEKKIEPKAPVSAEPSTDVLSSLETKVNELQTRLKVIKKMIQKQPKKRDELKVRMKVVTKMIDKLNSQIKEAKSKSSKKKLPKKGLGGFLLGALGGFIAGQMIDLQLTRKKVRFQLGGTMEGDKKYKYSITYQTVTPESAEDGDYADNGYVIQDEVEELQDILQEAVNRYGIYEPSSVGYKDGKRSVSAGCWWSSTSPDTDRDYWEKGHEKYYSLHINNIDGSELNQEESQFITDKLSEGRNLHWDDEEKKWWRDGGQIHSEDKDGELIFKADTKGGKYSIEVRESNEANGVSYSTYEYTGGSLRGMGGNNNREILIHRLLDTIIGSKKIDSINYIISVDKLGVKDYLPYAEKIYDIYNSKEIREWYVALPQEKKDELTKYSNEKAIKYVKDNDYRYNDSTIGSFASLFRREKMVKDFYESQGKVILENGGSFTNENAHMVLNQNHQIKHHTEELGKIVDENTHVPAWVVTKVSDAANDLSDATHYLDGEKSKMENGGGVGDKNEYWTIKNDKGWSLGYKGSSSEVFYSPHVAPITFPTEQLANDYKKNSKHDFVKKGTVVKMFYNGGGVDDKKVDLFQNPELIPSEVNEILDKYWEEFGDSRDYEDTKRMLEEVEAVGYTFDYYLDNEPYGLRKKGVELNELEGYEKMAKGGYVDPSQKTIEFKNKYGSLILEVVSDFVKVKDLGRVKDLPKDQIFPIEIAEQIALITENRKIQIVFDSTNIRMASVAVHDSVSTAAWAKIKHINFDKKFDATEELRISPSGVPTSFYGKGGKVSHSQKQYNKEVDAYKWFVVDLKNKKAVSGWEYKQDAKDALSDYDGDKNFKVVHQKTLSSMGIENPKERFKNMESGGGVDDDKLYYVVGKKNGQLVDISTDSKGEITPMTKEDAERFVKSVEKSYDYNTVDILPYRGKNPRIKFSNGGGFGYSAKSFQLTKEEFYYLLPVLKNKLTQSGDRYYFISNNIEDLTDMLNRLKGLYNNYDELKNMVDYKCSMQGSLQPFRKSMGNLKTEKQKFSSGGGISDTPKVYIADLAAYNEGKLVGEWIDLSEFSSGDEVMDKISELLAKWSEEQGEEREEYAVHDMENFPKDLYHESMGEEDFQSVIDYWEAVGNSDYPKEVIEEYMSVKGEDNASDAVSSMEKSYQGKYSSKSDFAEQLVSDIGMPSNVSDYAYVTDTDRRIIAGEEADNVLDDMTDDEILERADMKEDADAYKEKESEIESLEEEIYSLDKEEDADELEKKEEELEELKNELAEMDTYDEVLKKAKEEIHDEIYEEWYDGLEDPYYFLVKNKGLYDDETFMKQSFIAFDYDKFAEELEADYTMIEHDGDVYVFSDNYKKGGNVGISNKVGMKKWNSMNSEQRKDFAMIHLGVGKRQQMILQKKKYEELPVRVKKELEKIK